MSDLISRSELLTAFNNKNIQITFDLPVEEVLGEDVDLDDFAMLVQDAIQTYKKMVIDTIKEQPTAYSVDKVVEELDKSSDYYECEEQGREHVQMVDLTEAIEIVKQGSVSDDVCEWIKYDYRTICPKNHYTNNPYWRIPDNTDKLKYCPYCGKKIKVVE